MNFQARLTLEPMPPCPEASDHERPRRITKYELTSTDHPEDIRRRIMRKILLRLAMEEAGR